MTRTVPGPGPEILYEGLDKLMLHPMFSFRTVVDSPQETKI